jgi:hypothetical protein
VLFLGFPIGILLTLLPYRYSDIGTMVDKKLIKRDVNDEYPSSIEIRQRSEIAFPASRVEKGLYTCKYI